MIHGSNLYLEIWFGNRNTQVIHAMALVVQAINVR